MLSSRVSSRITADPVRAWSRAASARGSSTAALAADQVQHRPQSSPAAPVADAFQDAVRQKRFHCTQCGKCCTGPGNLVP